MRKIYIRVEGIPWPKTGEAHYHAKCVRQKSCNHSDFLQFLDVSATGPAKKD